MSTPPARRVRQRNTIHRIAAELLRAVEADEIACVEGRGQLREASPPEPAVPGVETQVRDAKAQAGERRLEILQQGRLSCPMWSDDRGAIAQAFEPRRAACRRGPPGTRTGSTARGRRRRDCHALSCATTTSRPLGDMTISRRSTDRPGSTINSIAQMIEMSFPEKL